MRYLLFKLFRWAITYEQEKLEREVNKVSRLRSEDTQETPDNYYQRQYLELNNKFMALCSHLGVYVTRNIPVSEYKVEKMEDMRGTLASEAALRPTTNVGQAKARR